MLSLFRTCSRWWPSARCTTSVRQEILSWIQVPRPRSLSPRYCIYITCKCLDALRKSFQRCCRSRSYVFGPPGSGSVSQSYGPGSGSFYHKAEKSTLRKTLIPTVLWLLYDFLSLRNDVSELSISEKQKTLEKNNIFVVLLLNVTDENSKIPIR